MKLEAAKQELMIQSEQVNREGKLLNQNRLLFEEEKCKMASTIGTTNEFLRKENWTMWHERLEQFFLANNVKEERKAALFLTLISREGYSILCSVCSPELPSAKTSSWLT